jgi:CheY-like chemotaxis protein
MRPLATEKKVELGETIDQTSNTVEADASRLQQVVTNLVHNAVKFTPPGGRINVEMRRTGNESWITIFDTGIGIEKDFLPQIFERFAQAEGVSARTESGLGLGLAIAKQIVEMHGGSIAAESAGANQGATFTVRLPLAATESHAGIMNSGEKSQLENLLAGQRVLLIEDVAATRRALTAVLEQSGAEVSPVESAPAAWETLERRRPDVIVSDLGLPMVDGYAFIRQVRHAENALNARPVPAVALTAFAGESVSRKALEEGFQTCLTKPIEPVRLVNILASLIAKK